MKKLITLQDVFDILDHCEFDYEIDCFDIFGNRLNNVRELGNLEIVKISTENFCIIELPRNSLRHNLNRTSNCFMRYKIIVK